MQHTRGGGGEASTSARAKAKVAALYLGPGRKVDVDPDTGCPDSDTLQANLLARPCTRGLPPAWDYSFSPQAWESTYLERQKWNPAQTECNSAVSVELKEESQLYRCLKPTPVGMVFVRSLKTKAPHLIDLACDGDYENLTVSHVKRAYRKALAISSRKHVALRWQGVELEDSCTLEDCRVPDGATLDAAFRSRTHAQLDALGPLTHLLIVDETGAVLEAEASGDTVVSDLKAQSGHEPEVRYLFAAHFTSALGTPLENDRTLKSYGLRDGDVICCISLLDDDDGES